MTRSMSDASTREIFATDMDDEAAIRCSTQEISDVAEKEGAVLVVYGHDAEQWKTLRHSPDFYQ